MRYRRILPRLVVLLLLITACRNSPTSGLPLDIESRIQILDTAGNTLPRVKGFTFVRPEQVVVLRYHWHVLGDAPVAGNPRILVHLTDSGGAIVWQDDHDPVPPVRSWRKGENYVYDRLVCLPDMVPEPDLRLSAGIYQTGPPSCHFLIRQGDDHVRKTELCRLHFHQGTRVVYAEGWDMLEQDDPSLSLGRWTYQKAEWLIGNPGKPFYLRIRGTARPDCFDKPQKMTVTVRDAVLGTVIMSDSEIDRVFRVDFPDLEAGGSIPVGIVLDRTFVPDECDGNGDLRRLGVRLQPPELGQASFQNGFYSEERDRWLRWRWMGSEGLIEFINPHAPCRLFLSMDTAFDQWNAPPEIRLFLNGRPLTEFRLIPGESNRLIDLNPEQLDPEPIFLLAVRTDRIFEEHAGKEGIGRRLGVRVKKALLIPVD